MPSSALISSDHVKDLLDQQRGQPQGGFVQQHQPGMGHQRAANDQHLLLAAGKIAAGAPAQVLSRGK